MNSKSATFNLILINVVVFLASFILGLFFKEDLIFSYLALKPENIIQGKYLWTIFTSIFMHANFAHLFVNMFSLYFIGSFVERLIGKKRYIWFYILSGIFASIFFALLSGFFGYGFLAKIFGSASVMGVGASGAIFGLLGLLCVLTPYNKVYLIAGPLIAIILQSILGNYLSNTLYALISFLITIYFIFSIFIMFSFSKLKKLALPLEIRFWILPFVAIIPLIVIGLFVDLPIGNMAHLGGLILGIFYGIFLRNKYPKKTKMISRMFHK